MITTPVERAAYDVAVAAVSALDWYRRNDKPFPAEIVALMAQAERFEEALVNWGPAEVQQQKPLGAPEGPGTSP